MDIIYFYVYVKIKSFVLELNNYEFWRGCTLVNQFV
jgi:hypothetical protein